MSCLDSRPTGSVSIDSVELYPSPVLLERAIVEKSHFFVFWKTFFSFMNISWFFCLFTLFICSLSALNIIYDKAKDSLNSHSLSPK